jgi:signal transduction histidine kinase
VSVLLVGYVGFFVQKDQLEILPAIWGFVAVLWLTPIFNYFERTGVARFILSLTTTTGVLILSVMDAPGPPYPFFAVIIFPFVLFDTKNQWAMFSSLALSLVYYFIYDYYYDFLSTRDLMHYFIIYSTFGIMIYALFSFFKNTNRAEERLSHANLKIDDAHSELSEQHEELIQTTDKLMTTQEALFEYQKTLEDEKDRAEAAVKVKEQFLSSMSHELRTPLNGIIGFADYMQVTQEYDEDSINSIKYSAERLSNILGDILSASADEYGELKAHMAPLKVTDMIQELFGSLERNLAYSDVEGRLEIAKDLPNEIISDETKLFQIIGNLLSNAVKHTEFGSVTLKVSLKNKEIHMSVIDTGSGIRTEDHETIFDKFRQVGDKPGTGLGLYICRRLSQVVNGYVFVKSSEGVGSVFTLAVPVAPPVMKEALTSAKLSYPGKTVLIIEDDEMSAEMLKKLMTYLEFEATIVGNGTEALEILESNKFDLVLSDLNLPGASGVELIRGISEKSDAPLAVLSAQNSEVGAHEVTRAGANIYFSKPLEQKKMFEYLDSIFTS